MNRKEELSFLIKKLTSNESCPSGISDASVRYFDSFLLLTKNKGKEKVLSFLTEYTKLLQANKIPFLKLNTLISLFERWVKFPEIISDLIFFSKSFKGSLIHEELVYLLTRSSGLNRDHRHVREVRLIVFATALNRKVLAQEDIHINPSLCSLFMEIEVSNHDLSLRKRGFRLEEGHPYLMLFRNIKRMKASGVEVMKINEMVNLHFSPNREETIHTEKNLSFFEILNEKLPSDYLSAFKHHELLKLFFLYKIRPELFDDLEYTSEGTLNVNSVIRSLFKNFIVSELFINAYCREQLNAQERTWFVHVLKGNNLINATGLPVTLTRKGAHNFRCLSGVEMSVKRGVILAACLCEIDNRAYAIRVVDSIRNMVHADFWIKTMSGLYKKGFPQGMIQEVMDYIEYKTFTERVDLDLKHKKCDNLINDVQTWHRELRLTKFVKQNAMVLPDSGIEDAELEHNGKMFIITQLKKSEDLYLEGNDLDHCVYSYRYSCSKGESFIFSLRLLLEENQKKPLITIQLVGNRIVQAKGKFNRRPTETEKKLISIWAKQNQLHFAA